LIYQCVTLGAGDVNLFLRTVDSKPQEFFAAHVKHLCLSSQVSSAKATRVLKVCTGVAQLALWVDYGGKLPVSGAAAYLSRLRLKRLSIEHSHLINFLANAQKTPPAWCDTLTHLEVIFWKTVQPSVALPGLDRLPSLTHLTVTGPGLHDIIHEPWLAAVISDCPGLRVVLVLADEDEVVEEPFQIGNCWVVPIEYPVNIVTNWEASFWGLPDLYSRAEGEIKLKELRGSSSLMAGAPLISVAPLAFIHHGQKRHQQPRFPLNLLQANIRVLCVGEP